MLPCPSQKLGGKDPTPPRPTTNTFAFAIYPPSFLNNSSALSVHSAIFIVSSLELKAAALIPNNCYYLFF
jgi:hypothetical protein